MNKKFAPILLALIAGIANSKDNRCQGDCAIGSVAYTYSTSSEPGTACGKPELKSLLGKYSFDGQLREAYENLSDRKPTGLCFTPKNGLKVIVLSKPHLAPIGGLVITVSPESDRNIAFDVNANYLDKTR